MKKRIHFLTAFLLAMLTVWTLNASAQTSTVTVLQPSNAGISWARGTTHLISWNGNLTKPVKIELYKNHVYVKTLSASRTGTTYSWYIDPLTTAGTDYQIKVESTTNSSVSDLSDNYFSITKTNPNPTIHVLQPSDASISWVRGTTHLISWNDNLSEPVKIELYKNHVYVKTLSASRSGTTYSWYIDLSTTAGTDYQIQVESTKDGNVSDLSDNYFSITKTNPAGTITVLQPSDAGISWARGTTHLISWNDDLSEPVKIELYKNHVYVKTLSASRSGTTYSWYIDPLTTAGTDYQIQVESTKDGDVSDLSDNYFSITLPATIDAYPNPSTTHFTVRFNENENENYILTLYNRYNMRVMSRWVNTAFMKEVRINTYDLPNGIYFLRLTSGKQVISRKIIVQH